MVKMNLKKKYRGNLQFFKKFLSKHLEELDLWMKQQA